LKVPNEIYKKLKEENVKRYQRESMRKEKEAGRLVDAKSTAAWRRRKAWKLQASANYGYEVRKLRVAGSRDSELPSHSEKP
jgi:hypothetical protein